MTLVIALLGAESTGKTDLARALQQRMAAAGIDAAVVPEYLREFCDRLGRTPRADEQAHIVAEQTRRIAKAAGSHDVVLADTTALMPAVYSELLFDDRSLYEEALHAQQGYDLTLVTGLDLPWQADGHQRDGPHVREPVDALVRARLQRARLSYSVVYGLGAARIDAAWRVIAPALVRHGYASIATPAPESESGDRPARLRSWCRECLVPECEHLLFRRR